MQFLPLEPLKQAKAVCFVSKLSLNQCWKPPPPPKKCATPTSLQVRRLRRRKELSCYVHNGCLSDYLLSAIRCFTCLCVGLRYLQPPRCLPTSLSLHIGETGIYQAICSSYIAEQTPGLSVELICTDKRPISHANTGKNAVNLKSIASRS